MKKPPYELESLRAAVFRCDRNIAVLQQAIQNEEITKDQTNNPDTQAVCMKNITIFQEEIGREQKHKGELNYYIKEHEKYKRHVSSLNDI